MDEKILTIDSHIDIPKNFTTDMFTNDANRQVDFPKMEKGGLGAACFVAYVPQGPCDQKHYEQAYTKACDILKAIQSQKGSKGGIEVVVCSQTRDIIDAHRRGKLIAIPVIENGYVMGEDVNNLKIFSELGARYMTLTHNGHNALADSSVPRPALGNKTADHGGLSSLGREAIEAMNALGIVVDVSHGSKQTMMQAVRASKTPVIASHSCVKALCNHRRNLDDEQLKTLADSGGVIQITAMADFLRKGGDRPNDPVTISDLVDHLDYVVKLVGTEAVGISSDFEGGGGVKGWEDASQTRNITDELRRRNYSQKEIAAFWGGNLLRVLKQAEDNVGH